MNHTARIVVTTTLLLVTTRAAHAQPAGARVTGATVGGTLAWASLWDDETHLGRGLVAAGEFTASVGTHLRVAAEAGWFGHDRDAGYLAADGTVLSLMGRASVLPGPSSWRARPLLGAGVGIARSTGTLSLQTSVAGPGSTQPEIRSSWSLKHLAWELHAGVRVRANGRMAVRPEVRVGVIGGTRGDSGAVEPPLLRLQGGVAFEWAVQ